MVSTNTNNLYEKALWYYYWAIILLSIYCIVYNFITVGRIETYVPYTEIPLGMNCNYFALLVLVAICFSIHRYITVKSISAVIAFVLLSTSLLLTMGRMAIVSYLLILLYYQLRFKVLGLKHSLIVLTLVGVFICLLAINSRFGPGRIQQSFSHLFEGRFDQLMLVRSDVYSVATELILEKPFTGYGIAGSQEALNRKYEAYGHTHPLQYNYHAHNQYLQYGLYWGVLAMVILIVLLILPFFVVGLPKYFIPMAITFSLTFLTDSPLTDYRVSIVFFALYALPLLLILRSRKYAIAS